MQRPSKAQPVRQDSTEDNGRRQGQHRRELGLGTTHWSELYPTALLLGEGGRISWPLLSSDKHQYTSVSATD